MIEGLERALRRLEHRAKRIAFDNRVEDTRALWEPEGYRVTVSADGAGTRILIEPEAKW